MPRATKSKISEIVGFFRACSLEVMDVAKELIDDVVRERKGKSTKARERAQAAQPGTTTDAAPAAVPRKAKKAKGVSHKKRGPRPRNTELPLDALSGTGDAGEAGDADALQGQVGAGQSAPAQTLTAP